MCGFTKCRGDTESIAQIRLYSLKYLWTGQSELVTCFRGGHESERVFQRVTVLPPAERTATATRSTASAASEALKQGPWEFGRIQSH